MIYHKFYKSLFSEINIMRNIFSTKAINKKALSYSMTLLLIIGLVVAVAVFSSMNSSSSSAIGYAVVQQKLTSYKKFLVKADSKKTTTGKTVSKQKPKVVEWDNNPKCKDSDVSKSNAYGKDIDSFRYINLNKKGTVSVWGLSLPPETLTDSCVDKQKIKEWYCDRLPGGRIIHANDMFVCKLGTECRDGACVPKK